MTKVEVECCCCWQKTMTWWRLRKDGYFSHVVLEVLAPFCDVRDGGRVKRLAAQAEFVDKEVILWGYVS